MTDLNCPLLTCSLSIGTNSTPRACCYQSEHSIANTLSSITFDEIKTLKHNEKLIKYFDRNEFPPSCSYCKTLERNLIPSPRLEFIDQFKKQNIKEIIYLDITIDNNCNLECIMCSPNFSYRLDSFYHSQLKFSNFPKWEIQFNDNELLSLLPQLTMITLRGGELFLSKRGNILLSQIAKTSYAKNITLRIFSNLTIIPKNIELLLANFKSIELNVSIDSLGINYEFIRYPFKWEDAHSNLLLLKKIIPHNTVLKIQTLLMAINWNHIGEFINFHNRFNPDSEFILPTFNEIQIPALLHPTVLPKKEFEQGYNDIFLAIDNLKIRNDFDKKNILHFKSLLSKIKNNSHSDLFFDFQIFIAKIKKHRSQK